MRDEDLPSIDELTARLHSRDTPHDDLPVGGFRPVHDRWKPRPAAVLIAIVQAAEPVIVLTVRSRRMAIHAGQVALPGGRPESGESFPLATALREAGEEIGIDTDAVFVHGLLDRFDTITGYRIVPVVATIEDRPRLQPCPDEVEEIFMLPLATVLDPGIYRKHRVTRGGHSHDLYTIPHPRWMIWGATAAILHQLCMTLKGDE